MPLPVFCIRNNTPALQGPLQRNRVKKLTSWYDLSSTSQPPCPPEACRAEASGEGGRGRPTSSPFCACQSAAPSGCQPARLDPLKVVSGLNSLAGPCAVTRTAGATATVSAIIQNHARIDPPALENGAPGKGRAHVVNEGSTRHPPSEHDQRPCPTDGSRGREQRRRDPPADSIGRPGSLSSSPTLYSPGARGCSCVIPFR